MPFNVTPWHLILVLAYIAFFAVPLWRIVRKAGYHGAWSLCVFVPVLNVIAFWYFAFARWPVQR